MVSLSQYGVLNLDGNSGDYHTVSIVFPENEDNNSRSEIGVRMRTFLWDTAYRQVMAQLPDEENAD